jgi:hypothetical protein
MPIFMSVITIIRAGTNYYVKYEFSGLDNTEQRKVNTRETASAAVTRKGVSAFN